MDDHAFRNRALGVVIGSAVGDALGAPFEFGSAGAYTRRFPSPVVGGSGEMIGGRPWKPGEFTDDTQMAIAQAESLRAMGRIDGADLFERFRVWSLDAADIGNQTRAVLGSGFPWDEAATEHFLRNPTGAAGNGTVMRAAASAVYFANQSLSETMTAGRGLAAITHGDPAAGWGTALYHALVHVALHDGDPFIELPTLLDTLPADQHRFNEMLAAEWRPRASNVSNGSVWGCLAQAVWAVRTTSTFADAMVAAIELGGDTDTVAAVAGGLAGAIYGIQSIPSRWTTYLNGSINTREGMRRYRLADLQLLALALIGERVPAEAAAGSPIGPTEIVDGVCAANLAGASTAPNDWAVVSLCRVGDRFANHPVRRELYLIDKADGQNQSLGAVVLDAVDSIDAFLQEGRKVVVHCHAGASRTGLVLRAWLMRRNHLTAADSTELLSERWPHLDSSTNESFTRFLNDEWQMICNSTKGGGTR